MCDHPALRGYNRFNTSLKASKERSRRERLKYFRTKGLFSGDMYPPIEPALPPGLAPTNHTAYCAGHPPVSSAPPSLLPNSSYSQTFSTFSNNRFKMNFGSAPHGQAASAYSTAAATGPTWQYSPTNSSNGFVATNPEATHPPPDIHGPTSASRGIDYRRDNHSWTQSASTFPHGHEEEQYRSSIHSKLVISPYNGNSTPSKGSDSFRATSFTKPSSLSSHSSAIISHAPLSWPMYCPQHSSPPAQSPAPFHPSPSPLLPSESPQNNFSLSTSEARGAFHHGRAIVQRTYATAQVSLTPPVPPSQPNWQFQGTKDSTLHHGEIEPQHNIFDHAQATVQNDSSEDIPVEHHHAHAQSHSRSSHVGSGLSSDSSQPSQKGETLAGEEGRKSYTSSYNYKSYSGLEYALTYRPQEGPVNASSTGVQASTSPIRHPVEVTQDNEPGSGQQHRGETLNGKEHSSTAPQAPEQRTGDRGEQLQSATPASSFSAQRQKVPQAPCPSSPTHHPEWETQEYEPGSQEQRIGETSNGKNHSATAPKVPPPPSSEPTRIEDGGVQSQSVAPAPASLLKRQEDPKAPCLPPLPQLPPPERKRKRNAVEPDESDFPPSSSSAQLKKQKGLKASKALRPPPKTTASNSPPRSRARKGKKGSSLPVPSDAISNSEDQAALVPSRPIAWSFREDPRVQLYFATAISLPCVPRPKTEDKVLTEEPIDDTFRKQDFGEPEKFGNWKEVQVAN